MTHTERRGSTGSFIAGMLVGAAIGAGFALLQAPQSGHQTRQQIKHTADEVRGQAETVMTTARTHAKEAAEDVSRHASEIRSEAQSAVEDAKRNISESAEKIKQEVEAGAHEVKREADQGAAQIRHQTHQTTDTG